MAIKNVLGSDYAAVDMVEYDKKGKNLSFALIMYESEDKVYENNRLQYNISGSLEVREIGGVITKAPSECDYEEEVADFDFDLYKSFKWYVIGEGSDLGREGYIYCCENPPHADADGNYPHVDEQVEVANPDFEEYGATMTVPAANPAASIGAGEFSASEATQVVDVPETITITREKTLPLKYDWGALSKRVDNVVFKDPKGKYYDVTRRPGDYPVTYKVKEVSNPFTEDEWDKWFSADAMNAKDTNILSQIYAWLLTQPGFGDAKKA